MSIISSGSAAVAIQTLLRKFKLPNLKVLVDHKMRPEIQEALALLGCEVYRSDLGKKPLHWQEILQLTHNPDGLDITSSEALDSTTRFFDWLAYEIINESALYSFVPFGTGNLYENILNINKREITTSHRDPRFSGSAKSLRICNFIGATTNDPSSKADKLYSAHLPFVHFDEQWIRTYKFAGFCGPQSNVHLIEERYLEEAIDLANDLGLKGEPSGLAGLAMLLQFKEILPRDKKMLVVNTGQTTWPENLQYSRGITTVENIRSAP